MQTERMIFFIAGPTASGKSGVALRLAQKVNGEIVNADALQVYSDLQILSARPSLQEQGTIAHHLYGYLKGDERCSAGIWARRAGPVIEDILTRNKAAIVVGGTGLYFRALSEGLSPIPDIPASSRAAAEQRCHELGLEAFYQEVVNQDPPMERLAIADRQRLLRAWEVHHATGRSLSYFQSLPREPVIKEAVTKQMVLLPPREKLYAHCDLRFLQMVEAGALEEARQLLALGYSLNLPVMKALGVSELLAHLRGELELAEAIELAQRNTRRFAKRQMTWFRGQAGHWYQAETDAQVYYQLLAAAGLG